jgi:hypothetical protein
VLSRETFNRVASAVDRHQRQQRIALESFQESLMQANEDLRAALQGALLAAEKEGNDSA